MFETAANGILKNPVCKRMVADFLKAERAYTRNPNEVNAEVFFFQCGELIGYLIGAPNMDSHAASSALSLAYKHYYNAKLKVKGVIK